jgi:large subunit ribosomal protein L22
MQFVATQKNVRQTTRKVRLVANEVKDLPLEDALKQLALMQRKAATVVMKTLRQAIANAEHNHDVPFEDLEIETIMANEGPTMKRFRAVARGRAHTIEKRTTHVRVVLKEREMGAEEKAAPKKKATPKKTTKKADTNTAKKQDDKKKKKKKTTSKKKEDN